MVTDEQTRASNQSAFLATSYCMTARMLLIVCAIESRTDKIPIKCQPCPPFACFCSCQKFTEKLFNNVRCTWNLVQYQSSECSKSFT